MNVAIKYIVTRCRAATFIQSNEIGYGNLNTMKLHEIHVYVMYIILYCLNNYMYMYQYNRTTPRRLKLQRRDVHQLQNLSDSQWNHSVVSTSMPSHVQPWSTKGLAQSLSQ